MAAKKQEGIMQYKTRNFSNPEYFVSLPMFVEFSKDTRNTVIEVINKY